MIPHWYPHICSCFTVVMTSNSGKEWEKRAVCAGNEGGGFGERKNANVQLERDVVIIKQ